MYKSGVREGYGVGFDEAADMFSFFDADWEGRWSQVTPSKELANARFYLVDLGGAHLLLGTYHAPHNGHGVAVDKQMAIHWFELAANQGSELAQKNLAAVQRQLEEVSAWMGNVVESSLRYCCCRKR